MTIVALLAQRAGAWPRRAAFGSVDGETLSYAQWDDRSTAAARALASRIARGERVALAFSIATWNDYAVAYLAVAKAGGVCVPVPRGMSARDLRELLARVGARLLLVASAADAPDERALPLAQLEQAGGPPLTRRPPSPEEPAEVLFTSGTTGPPKPLVATHANLAHGARPPAEARTLPAICHATGFASNAAQTLLVLPLGRHVRTVVSVEALDGATLAAVCGRYGVAEITASPATLALLADDRAHDVSAIRRVNAVGAPSTAASLRRVAERFADAQVVNVYTSTEAWPARTTLHVGEGPEGSLGRPRGGSRVAILDERGRPLGAGEVGRIALTLPAGAPPRRPLEGGGDGTTVPTGDVGFLDEDGCLHIADRERDVVNAGGAKLYTLELEAAIAELPAVAEAAVVGLPHPTLGEYAVAALVLEEATELADVKAAIAARLGARRTPHEIVAVALLPRGAGEKVDKRALRELLLERRPAEPPEPPAAAGRADLDGQVLAAWEDALGIAGIGGDDSFFSLGGNSLLAIRIVTDLSERLGVDLRAAAYVGWSTPAEMAGVLRATVAQAGAPSGVR